jgi:hypothetical protein
MRRENGRLSWNSLKMPRPGCRALARPMPARGSHSPFHRKSRLPRRSRDKRRRAASGFQDSYPARAERRSDRSSTAHSFSALAPDDPQDGALADKAKAASRDRQWRQHIPLLPPTRTKRASPSTSLNCRSYCDGERLGLDELSGKRRICAIGRGTGNY